MNLHRVMRALIVALGLELQHPIVSFGFAKCSPPVLLTVVNRSTEDQRAGGAASWRAARSTRSRDPIPRKRRERSVVIVTWIAKSRSTDARSRSARNTAGRPGTSFEREGGRTRLILTPNLRSGARSAESEPHRRRP